MADLVESVLQSAAAKEAKLKSVEVHKDLDVEIDAGNLLLIDQNPLDVKELRTRKEEYLKSLSRDNVQLLISKIWELPIQRVEDAVVAELPEPTTRLPREKPIPQVKPATKWENYAKLKGIQKRKRGRKVWDEETKEWKPRWGYNRANDPTKEWVLEVPQNADPYEDQFEKLKKAKKERVAKNELQRLRNIARNMKGKMPGIGLLPTDKPDKDHLSRALHAANKSTASVGRFTQKLAKEKPAKGLGKKRKFESNTGSMTSEKKRALDIFQKVQSKKPVLDTSRAANMHMAQEDQSRAKSKKSGGKGMSQGKRMKGKGGPAKGGPAKGTKGKAGGKGGKRKGKK